MREVMRLDKDGAAYRAKVAAPFWAHEKYYTGEYEREQFAALWARAHSANWSTPRACTKHDSPAADCYRADHRPWSERAREAHSETRSFLSDLYKRTKSKEMARAP